MSDSPDPPSRRDAVAGMALGAHHLRSDEHQRVTAALRAYRQAREELTALGVLRSERNIPGEYGEWLVARLLGLTLATNAVQAGYDATDPAGVTYQIKVRCVRDLTATTSFDVKDAALPFDVLLGVLLSPQYELLAIIQVSREAFVAHAAKNRTSTRLRWLPALFEAPWITIRFCRPRGDDARR
jgi:hypothetical protein